MIRIFSILDGYKVLKFQVNLIFFLNQVKTILPPPPPPQRRRLRYVPDHRYMIYTNKGMLLATLSYDTCDVIPCVCPVIDHGSRPMKALEFLTILYNSKWFHRILNLHAPRQRTRGECCCLFASGFLLFRNQEISVSKTIDITRNYYRKESAASPPRDGSMRNLLNKAYNQFQKSWDRCHKTFEFQQTTIPPAPCSMLCPIPRRV